MDSARLRDLLEQVRAGRIGVDEALAAVSPGVADLGYANVDLHRRKRCGFPEVIFCEGKTPAWVEGIVRQIAAAGQDCLATRVSDVQAAHLAPLFPDAEQDRVARTFWLPTPRRAARGSRQGPRPDRRHR